MGGTEAMWHLEGERRGGRLTRARRPLIIAAIIGGAILQHILATTPPEPVPATPTVPALNVPATVPVQPLPHATAASLAVNHGTDTTAHPSSVIKGAHLLAPTPAALHALAGALAGSTPDGLTDSVDHAFAAYALPYQADSALIVTVARQFGIDPAIPAALFMHEDGNINNRALFPTHMNWLLYNAHNPGNIKCMYQPCYNGFQVYPTYRAGILDWFRLYDHYYVDLGIHDLASFIATYCPAGVDGNGAPATYEADVLQLAARIRAGW